MARFRDASEYVLTIPSFLGVDQGGDGVNLSPRLAVEAVGADFSRYTLRPARRPLAVGGPLPAAIGALAILHRRHAPEGEARDVMVAAAGGALYARVLPAGDWRAVASGYASDAWDSLAYEINRSGEGPTDVLLLTNAKDGMVCLFGDDLHVEAVETPRKFGVIARHAERIWGAGIPGEPDMLAYSAPFDPLDWAANVEAPEAGAGDILQPSWDGDGFTALRTFGEYLLAFKRRSLWRVSGVGPGEYAFAQVYGGGTAAENTVCVDRDRVWMLGLKGLNRFDGLVVSPYEPDRARAFFESLRPGDLEGACAALFEDRYFLAAKAGEGAGNDSLLIVDRGRQVWSTLAGLSVRAFCPTETALYFTSAADPYGVYAFGQGEGVLPLRWVCGWQDLGARHVRKSHFAVRLLVQSEVPVELSVTVETEEACRTRRVLLDGRRQRCLRFGHGGTRFRLILASEGEADWELSGGLSVEMALEG